MQIFKLIFFAPVVLLIVFAGCAEPYDEVAFVGQYYYVDPDTESPSGNPILILAEDGSCEFKVSYFHGICVTTGTYSVDGKLLVLTLSESDPDGFLGEKYFEGSKHQIHIAPEQYFTIIDHNTLQINDDVYAIDQGIILKRLQLEN